MKELRFFYTPTPETGQLPADEAQHALRVLRLGMGDELHLMDGKGVILYLYDYEQYVKDRDFYYPFDENVVGTKTYTFDELLHCMETDRHAIDDSDRQAILSRFWGDTARYNSSKMLMERFQQH